MTKKILEVIIALFILCAQSAFCDYVTIPDKNTGDSLSAAEFNQILDAIKDGDKGIQTNAVRADGDTTKRSIVVSGTLTPDWTGTYTYLDQYNSANRYYNAALGVYIWKQVAPPAYGAWIINQTPGTSGTGWYSYGSVNQLTVPYHRQDGLSWAAYGGYSGTLSAIPTPQYSLDITGVIGLNNLQAFTMLETENSIFIGNGGNINTTLIGVYDSPTDPVSSDGSYNGLFNTFIGIFAGYWNQTGNLNVFIGSSAGKNNANGTQNTFIGHAAGEDTTSGYHNTYIGTGAGQDATTASYNVAVGTDSALTTLTTGQYNVLVGSQSALAAGGNSNSIVIGSSVTGLGDNAAVIGNASLTKLCFSGGSICWFKGTGAPDNGLCTANNVGSLYSNVSGGASTTLYVCTGAATWTAK